MRKQTNNSLCVRVPGKSRQSGMTLIEMMIAMFVLTIGMLGSMVLIASGMQTNTRNRTDTTGSVLDQQVIEEFATLKNYPKTGTVRIWDCTVGNNTTDYHLASLVQGLSPSGAGAALDAQGNIDWTRPAPSPLATSTVSGYAMRYTTCSRDIYEVRWNVMQVGNNTASVNTRISLLTVSSRQVAAMAADSTGAGNNAILYARPTTVRTLIEQ